MTTAKVTQAVVRTVSLPDPSARVAQFSLRSASLPDPAARVAQFVVRVLSTVEEVALPTSDPVFWILVAT